MGKYLGDFTFDDEEYLEQLVDIIYFMRMIFLIGGPAEMAEGRPGPARGQSSRGSNSLGTLEPWLTSTNQRSLAMP